MSRTYSGFNKDTTKYLLLDAGAIFVNFDTEVDTYEEAKETKLIGATSGGNKFEAIPEVRQVEADGVKGKWKGGQHLTFWEVSLTTNLLEFREDTYKYALMGSESKEVLVGDKTYTEIQAKNFITDDDYLDNITFIGSISGSAEPVIVQIFNALSVEGLNIDNVDGEDIVAEIKFEGHYDSNNLDNPPFRILYPNTGEVITG